jgi:hypothetical protein
VPEGEATNPVFRNNPGKTAEFVRLRETSYVKNQCPYVSNCSRQSIQLGDHPYKEACQNCPFAKAWYLNKERKEANGKEYKQLKKNPDYTGKYADMLKFNPKTGGMTAVHNDHNFDPTPSKIFKDVFRGDYERNAVNVLYNYGRKVILTAEMKFNMRTFDGLLDDVPFDIKGIEKHITFKSIKRRFEDASDQNAEIMVFYFHDSNMFSYDQLKRGYLKYLLYSNSKRIQTVYYILNGKLNKL